MVNPELIADQLTPLFVERKTPPPYTAAKTFESLATRDQILYPVVHPESILVQFEPLLVDRNTPKPVPAKRLEPLVARDRMP